MFVLTLIISGIACAVGAVCGQHWGPALSAYADLYVAAGALILLGTIVPIVDALRGRLGLLGGRLLDVAHAPGLPHEVAALSYQVADKAFSGQAGLWQDLRGRVTTLVTVGPAAAAVVVATNGAKFDLLAALSLFFFTIAVAVSIWAVYRGRRFNLSPLLPPTLPPNTDAATLELALARKTTELLEDNRPRIKRYEELFLTAAASFLLAVLLWSAHAATNSQVFFTLR